MTYNKNYAFDWLHVTHTYCTKKQRIREHVLDNTYCTLYVFSHIHLKC